MIKRIDRYWRVLGTAASFAIFGIGGLFLRVTAFPIINLLVRERSTRTAIARDIVRLTFRFFVMTMQALGVLRYQILGQEKLERGGLLVIANHPTLIDTVFLLAFVKNADCVVKSALWNNPFTRGPLRAAGYINNADGPGLLEACIASLKSGANLVIFPEGTRTLRDAPPQFKRGASNIAIRGECDLTPVVIRCTPATLGKGEKWWQVPADRVHLRLEVRDDIPVRPFLHGEGTEPLAARRLTDHLQHYFVEELRRDAVA